MSSTPYDRGEAKQPGDAHAHNANHEHVANDHTDHAHAAHEHAAHDHVSHDHLAHGHAAHGHGGHGAHDHGAHGHGAHGHGAHGHDAHGHGAHGHDAPQKPSRVGLGALLGILILLGIPSLFSKFGSSDGQSTQPDLSTQDTPREGLLSSYSVANTRSFDEVEVKAFQRGVIETSHAQPIPVIYLLLASGERFMAMDVSELGTLGVSNAAMILAKEAYRKAAGLQPGYFKLKVTGEPPLELILAGIAPLVIGISPS
jgi:hypothetical protein